MQKRYSGLALVEYMLIIILMFAAVLGAFLLFGHSVTDSFKTIPQQIQVQI